MTDDKLCGQCGIRISGGVCQCVSVLEARVAELEAEQAAMSKINKWLLKAGRSYAISRDQWAFRFSLHEWMSVWQATGKTWAEAAENALAVFEESLK